MTIEVTVPELPTPETLERTFQCLAMLDALLSPEWQYRYHSFNTHCSNQERMGTIRDGSGDELFFLFLENGCAFKGYMQEFGNYALPDE
ncbi:hypothetical protein [Deinococcus ruber]|uniref:Uncharacterized protein n=1 Tax=Deinococcus ruber TaxID=1848197 RepID=A0A918FC54_9DEIO|nr:hypothetical protein [Deinococcus ruber]GGR29532.1 hypothetical protein GCM10008957_45580 [Deinococcus ruber]